ncbi:NAD-dependent dehydratase [Pseudoclavibacter endophyticus]|uniref:NAD(P)H-binding protein n=1 Tax=Pseudoclavibacter endophyticus TaxID=1778590 RepID=A0A6H9WBS1_9MICO|nr:NAD(P)H-binding protein [Pseudoclavibacter endophyticus]KAB1648113.1 NAD(P)H-binding protein [Pseudoclavibacter endophyticus]GGA69844.1 NAD-dependent dehydratase [Pseudoclavibacter endophyticus]
MKVAIVGGHGQIALRLTQLLHAHQHEVVGLIRNPDHQGDVRAHGGEPWVVDLERSHTGEVAMGLSGADAIVFAAGAGPGSGAARKITMDRDGAVLTADAARLAGIKRLVIVSSINADRHDGESDDVFQVYLRAKAEADDEIRARADLEYTIVRPGSLTNDAGTGHVTVGQGLDASPVTRDDVALVLREALEQRAAIRMQFDLVNGDTPVGEAVASL